MLDPMFHTGTAQAPAQAEKPLFGTPWAASQRIHTLYSLHITMRMSA